MRERYLEIPSLPGTCQRYLDIVAPLLPPAERQRTEQAVAEFQLGAGPARQASVNQLSP